MRISDWSSDVCCSDLLHLDGADAMQTAFLASLALAAQPRTYLHSLYSGWIGRLEALNASRLTGAFAATDNGEIAIRRRHALDAHPTMSNEIEVLRGKAKHGKHLRRRAELNRELQRREAERAEDSDWR